MSMIVNPYVFGTGSGGGGSDYETAVLADNPLAFYLLDEASGTTAADSSGNNRDATISGTPDFQQTGPSGLTHAMGFNSPSGTDEWLTVPDLSSLSPVALEVWFSDDVTVNSSMTFQRVARAGTDGDNLFFGPVTGNLSDEIITVQEGTGGGFGARAWADSSGSAATGWHHLLVQWRSSGWQVWLDGGQIDNVQTGSVGNWAWDTIDIANNPSSTANPYRGLMAAAAFYASTLSVERIWERQVEGAGETVGSWVTEVGNDTPTAWWRLGESSGTTANDEQNAHDGTYSGVTLGATGLTNDADTAAEWDTSTDYMEVADHADFEASTFTFEAWVKHDNPAGDLLGTIADKTGLASANNSWALWYENRSSQGSPSALRFICNGTTLTSRDVSTEIGAGAHVVVVHDGSIALIFCNGVLVGSSSANSNQANSLPLRIGQQANGTSFGWDGIIDEVVFYSGSALSPQRVTRHYIAGSS